MYSVIIRFCPGLTCFEKLKVIHALNYRLRENVRFWKFIGKVARSILCGY